MDENEPFVEKWCPRQLSREVLEELRALLADITPNSLCDADVAIDVCMVAIQLMNHIDAVQGRVFFEEGAR